MHIFELWNKSMCHLLKYVKHSVASSTPTIPSDKIIKHVPKFHLSGQEAGSESCVIHTAHQTGSFSRVCKKECSPHTLSNISFEQNIPMSKGLVTSEASVLCFFFIYSFPVCASLLISAETSSAGEAINRWNLCFRKLNEIRWNIYQIRKYDTLILHRDKIY